MEPPEDGGWGTVGRVQGAGEEGALVLRVLRLPRVHQGSDGVQQAPGGEHGPETEDTSEIPTHPLLNSSVLLALF